MKSLFRIDSWALMWGRYPETGFVKLYLPVNKRTAAFNGHKIISLGKLCLVRYKVCWVCSEPACCGSSMLTVETYVSKAGNKGLGLYAGEFIRKGSTWHIDENILDRVVPKSDVDIMRPLQRQFLVTYGSLRKDGSYYVCMDNARFVNHSDNPNTVTLADRCIAKVDISIGEEITCDYREISEERRNHLGFVNRESE